MLQFPHSFCIFVSSTFSDLKAGRNALQEMTFPHLRDLASVRGCRFHAIDLRMENARILSPINYQELCNV